jgi:hypothetical protein
MSAATVAAIATIATAGVGIAGAAGAFNPDAPSPMNYGAISRDAQQAQIDLLPAKYAADAQYSPKFAELQNQISYNNLFGTKAGTTTGTKQVDQQGWRNSVTGEISQTTQQPHSGWTPPSHNGQGGTPNPWQPYTYQVSVPTTTSTPATVGTLGIMEQAQPRLNALAANANTSQRTADIGDVAKLGPAALAALKGFDPQSTVLMDQLAGQAKDELAAGSNMTPGEQRQYEQAVRAGQAARGMGVGPVDVFDEAMNVGQMGQQRLQQRQTFAGNVINQRSQLYGDPFQQILGRTSGRSLNPNQFATGGPLAVQDAGGAPYAIAGANQQMASQYGIAGYNSQMGSIGSLLKTNWGSVAGGLGGLFGGSGGGAASNYGAGSSAY